MATKGFQGILVPVVTPFDAGLAPDSGRWITFCRNLLAEGAGGLAVFGTTSEANSLSAAERMGLLEALVASGVPAETLMPGTGACSIDEAATLLRHARGLGCGGVLMLPPFYYKAVTDDGLFEFYARAIDRAGDPPPIYLYHIPPVAKVGLSLDLVGRLKDAFPECVVGIKDSSGEWANTAALLNRFPGFQIFPGSESFLLEGMRHGAAGCISATANVNLTAIRGVYDRWRSPEAEGLQARVTACRRIYESVPVVPGLKAVIADRLDDPTWARVRPPFVPLDAGRAASLKRLLAEQGFAVLAGWPLV